MSSNGHIAAFFWNAPKKKKTAGALGSLERKLVEEHRTNCAAAKQTFAVVPPGDERSSLYL